MLTLNKLNDKIPRIEIYHSQLNKLLDATLPIIDTLYKDDFSLYKGWIIGISEDMLDSQSKGISEIIKFDHNPTTRVTNINVYAYRDSIKMAKFVIDHNIELVDDDGTYIPEYWINPEYQRNILHSIQNRYGYTSPHKALDEYILLMLREVLVTQFYLSNYRQMFDIRKKEKDNSKSKYVEKKMKADGKGFYDPLNRIVPLKAVRNKYITINNEIDNVKKENKRHTDQWVKRGHWRVYRNKDGSIKKKIWIEQCTAKAKKPCNKNSNEKTYVIR